MLSDVDWVLGRSSKHFGFGFYWGMKSLRSNGSFVKICLFILDDFLIICFVDKCLLEAFYVAFLICY